MTFACGWRDGVLSVSGELDVHTAPELVRAAVEAIDAGRSALVIDLSQVTFMDCSGVTALLITRRRAIAAGKRVSLSGATGRVQKLLRLTRVEGSFAADAGTIVLPSTKESALGA